MKKLFFLLCFACTIALQAQQVSWGTPAKLIESFNTPTRIISGKYIGSVNGNDYYAYYSRHAKFFTTEGFQFVFCKVSNTGIQKFTEYTALNYNLIDVMVINDQIGVIYVTGDKKEKRNVKIDYYNPNTLTKAKTVTLFSFDPVDKYEPYKELLISPDKSQIALVVNGKNPESKRSSIIIKVYNPLLEEIWSENYDFNGDGYPIIGDMLISNSGKLIIHLNIYETEKYKKLISYNFVEFTNGNIREINTTQTTPKDLIDYKIKAVGEDQYMAVFTEEELINGYMVDFNKEEVNKVISYKVYEGYWKVDDVLPLSNGNFTIAVANRNLDILEQRNNNGFVNYKFFYWNRSICFICFNPNQNEIVYQKYLGREFNRAQGNRSEFPFITLDPYYFVKDNDVYLIYNTSYDTKDNQSNKKEAPFLMYMTCVSTKKPVAKMATISEDGKLKLQLLFDAKKAKGVFAPQFTHFNSEGEIIMAKFKNKYLSIGKMSL